MRYTGDLGCRYRGIPHDLRIVGQNATAKWERCWICNRTYRFNKSRMGRVDNQEYLKAHVRNFCQKFGATKAVYNRIYKPNNCKISI